MLQGKLYLNFHFFDKGGQLKVRRLNVLKYAKKSSSIGHFRSLLRSSIWPVVSFVNSKVVLPVKRCFTRKQRALGEILKRIAFRAKLDATIVDCMANPSYRFFFPELLDSAELARAGWSDDPLTKSTLGSLVRLGTIAEYEGDRERALAFGQPYVRNFSGVISFNLKSIQTHYWDLIRCEIPKKNWVYRRLRSLNISFSAFKKEVFYDDPRYHPDVTCLFHDRWPISVTAGDWKLDKPEYDILASSRTTGSARYRFEGTGSLTTIHVG